MSVITGFSVYSHCNDLGGNVWNPAIRWTKKYAVLVVLTNDKGDSGLGECWCFDTQPDALIAYLKTEIAPLVVGLADHELQSLHKRLLSRATLTARHGMLASAWSGIDIAHWDMQSRMAKLPLWRFMQQHYPALQPPANDKVRLYGSAGLYGKQKTTNDLVAEMRSIQAGGFDLVKMKVGGLSIDQDTQRVNAVLEGLPDSTSLIIDGVYSYSVSDALSLYAQLPADRLNAFQSPVPAGDLIGMKKLCQAGVPVMGTEAEYRHEIHSSMIASGAVHYLQVAPVAVGGITRVMELAETMPPKIKLSLEVSSTAVAFATAYQIALACSTIEHVEYHFVHQVFFDELQFTPALFINADEDTTSRHGIGISVEDVNVDFCFELA